jgi:hypothetical protein
MQQLDLRKELKYLYQPSAKTPAIVEVPRMRFLTVEGAGGVGEGAFQDAIGAIFSLGYPVRFGAKKQLEIEYPVMPLEGLYWDAEGGFEVSLAQAKELAWKLMMMVPFVIPADFIEATRAEVAAKKELPRLADVRVEDLAEGTSVQVMHIGPYDAETPTVERMLAFAAEQGYRVCGAHHEIYIGDPNRSAPDKLKTVLRYPVTRG